MMILGTLSSNIWEWKRKHSKKSNASSPGTEETWLLSWPSFQGTHYMKLYLLHCSGPGMQLISIRRCPLQTAGESHGLCCTKAMELRAFHFVACHHRKRARQLWLRERLPATFFTHYNLIWLSLGTILELTGPPEHQAETQTEWQREMHSETSLPLCPVLLLFSCMFDTATFL